MDWLARTHHQKLPQKISQWTRHAMDSRQVGERMENLLDQHHRKISREHRRHHRAGKADRLALLDKRHLDYLERLAQVKYQQHESRVLSETGRMMLAARQSIEAYYRAVARL